MANQTLLNWIGDQLHDLVGFSERNVELFIYGLARRAKTPQEIVAGLQSQASVGSDDKASRFATELFQRVRKSQPSKQVSTTSVSKSNAELLRESQRYSLIEPDVAPVEKKKSSSKTKKRRRRETVVDEDDQDSLMVTTAPIKSKSKQSAREETKHERQLREYQEFIGDKADREEYEMHLLKKEAERKEQARLAKEAANDDGRKQDMDFDAARNFSRQKYLEKRSEQEIKRAEAALRMEEEYFGGTKRSAREIARIKAEREMLELAKKRNAVGEELEARKRDGFTMEAPEEQSKRKTLDDYAGMERYKEDDAYVNEHELWEANQLRTATVSSEADRARRRKRERDRRREKRKLKNETRGESVTAESEEDERDPDDYDLVIEDQIEFISHEIIAGKRAPDQEEQDRAAADAAKAAALEDPRKAMAAGRKLLPIYAFREELLLAIKENQVLVIVGETGSGKTTQIPQFLHEEGYTKVGLVGCTQPRRVAAMSVAARVAQEVGCKLGHDVGYSIRFEDCTSNKTVLKYMTDGMLLREFLTSPDLNSYSVMMVDEAHERTLQTDVLFGLLKDISRHRKDLRLLISSATLDAQKFSEYFDDAPIFNIPGRRYEVSIMYTKAPEADYLDACIVTCLQVHVTQPVPGDVLIFLTGQEEIETAKEILTQRMRSLASKVRELIICPIYSTLPSEEQAKVFIPTPEGSRKVVLATNIAETSLTIDGIRHVIDTGFCKQTSFNPKTGMESLIVTPVSKAGAEQRAGRAGRTAAGNCFRLYTAWSYKHEMDDNTIPEIQRTNLSNVVILLKSLGIDDLIHFDFMDPPPAETLIRALEQLYALGALNDKGELTKLGRRMAEFPTDPQLAKMLLAAEKYRCTEEALSICAMLDVNATIHYRPNDNKIAADNARMNFSQGNGAGGDHLALLNIFNQWREAGFSHAWCREHFLQEKALGKARDIREQLEGLCDRVELERTSNTDPDDIRKAITAGYFYHCAKLTKDGSYRTVKNQHTVHIHPQSSLYKEDPLPSYVVYHQLQFTTKEYMRQLIVIKPDWLVEIAPHYYKPKEFGEGTKKKAPIVRSRNSGNNPKAPRMTKDGVYY